MTPGKAASFAKRLRVKARAARLAGRSDAVLIRMAATCQDRAVLPW